MIHISYEEFKEFEEKISECTRQIQQNPNDYMAYYNRGKIFRDLTYNGLHEYDEKAIPDFTQSIQLNSNYTEAYFNRGLSYFCLGQYEQAIQDFDKTIQLNPNHISAYFNRERVHSKLGNKEQSLQDSGIAASISLMADND